MQPVYDKSLLTISTLALTVSYAIIGLTRDLNDFVLLLLPLTCSMTIIHAVITSGFTKNIPNTSTGQILGLNMLLHSGIRIIATFVQDYMVVNYGNIISSELGMVSQMLTLIVLPFTKL
jgi:hypothetical protein